MRAWRVSMQTRVAVLVGWIVEEEVHGAFSLPSEGISEI
jgi:hypothetical protein